MSRRVAGPQNWGVPVGNLVISRSNHDNLFTFGLKVVILIFCGHCLKSFDAQDIKKCACDSVPIGENRMEKFQSVPEILRVQLLHPPPPLA